MLLIIIVTIIIITTIMTTKGQQTAIKKPLFCFPKFDQNWDASAQFQFVAQRFVTHGCFYMQQFGKPPKQTVTKRTFTLTNYYHPLYCIN